MLIYFYTCLPGKTLLDSFSEFAHTTERMHYINDCDSRKFDDSVNNSLTGRLHLGNMYSTDVESIVNIRVTQQSRAAVGFFWSCFLGHTRGSFLLASRHDL